MVFSVRMRFGTLVLICINCFVATCQLQTVPWAKLVPAKGTTSAVHSHEPFGYVSERLFNSSVEMAWKLFKTTYNKSILSETEDSHRFEIFRRNFRMILEHNERFELGLTTYRMDINEFADKTHDELRYLRGLRLPVGGLISRVPYTFDPSTPPESIDWRRKGAVTGVKNQGNCGSCWAFSTTGALEGHYFLKHHKLFSLSEQQLVDCSGRDGNEACNGGLMDFAFTYVHEAGGIETEECYPYVSGETGQQNPRCSLNKTCIVVKVKSYVDVQSKSESALENAVGLKGPVSIAINAALPSFSFYSSGIYEDTQCSGDESDLDHGVLAVGYGSENGTPYWIVKNSWGPKWGEGGYVRIRRNRHNMCGVATAASYPLVE